MHRCIVTIALCVCVCVCAAVLYIIYWHDLKLSVVALLTSLVVLATLCMNTMLHTIVLLLLSANVVSLLYIVIKIAIDSFYNRDIRNPFQ